MSKRAKSKTIKLNKKLLLFVLTLVLVCLFGMLYVSFSKYAIKVEDYHGVESEAFYFVSDILVNSDDGTKTYEINNWDGISTYTVPIVLKNYDDELKSTPSDIAYTIKVNSTEYKIGTLEGNKNSKESINVTVTNINTEKPEFTIEAISTSPYTKTLSATFKLNKKNEHEYNVNYIENEQDVILNINSYKDTQITISYDNTKYVLDNGQSIFNNKSITKNGTRNSVTTNIKKGEIYNITFIKVNSDIRLDTSSDIVVE